MIPSLKSERELKIIHCNTVKELPVTLEQIKQEALWDEYTNQIKANFFEKVSELQTRLLYMRRGVTVQGTRRDSVNTPETYLEKFLHWPPREY